MIEWYVYAILAILTGSFVLSPTISAPIRPFAQQEVQQPCTKVGVWCFNSVKVQQSDECKAALKNAAAGGKLDPKLFCN